MPGTRRDSKEARITPFARRCLDELVDKVSTTPPVVPLGDADLVGALIYAARRSPLEAIKANVGAYRDVEAEIGAVEAVCAFLRAHAG
jgi:hypothetical protein